MENLYKYNGFRLLELEVVKNKIFGNIHFKFVEDADLQNQFYTSVIIGPNGTRKSNLLNIIIKLFRQISEYKQGKIITEPVTGGFYLKYSLNGEIIEFTNFDRKKDELVIGDFDKIIKVAFYKNGIPENVEKIELPFSISASSMMLNDKFPFIRKEGFEIYNYLGLRNTPQSASTSSHIRKTVDFIVNTLDIPALIEGIRKMSKELLELNGNLTISYRTRNTPLFFRNLTEEKFDNYFQEIAIRYQDSKTEPPFALRYYLKNFKEGSVFKDELLDYCYNIFDKLEHIKKSSAKWLRFDLMNEDDIKLLRKDYKIIEALRRLSILTEPSLDIISNEEINNDRLNYSMGESSSGEYNIITSFIALMASIKVDSLILIDEPEVSLHPNWQMKYLNFMRDLFSNEFYKSCHFIIATHSHFMLSDLRGSNSKIIGLTKENGELKIIDFPSGIDTFGWSAEQVLLEIFNVPTTRNYYLESRIANILELMGNPNSDNEQIKEKINDLKTLRLDLREDDPMHEIMTVLFSKT